MRLSRRPMAIAFGAAVALVLQVGTALAQPAPAQPYAADFFACLDAEPQAETCIGRASQPCFRGEPDGETTLGMSMCLAMEGQLWEQELSRTYFEAILALRARDQSNREFFDERFSGAAEALAASQATWRAWAEAECRLVYAEAGSGSIRNLDAGACDQRLAAARLMRLRDILGGER